MAREGSQQFPQDQPLLFRYAMTLALVGKYQESVAAFEKCQSNLFTRYCKYRNVADCLLVRGQVELAIKCLLSIKYRRPEDDRLLALAYTQRGEHDRAEKIVTVIFEEGPFAEKPGKFPTKTFADTLLLLSIHLRRNHQDEARQMGEKIVENFRWKEGQTMRSWSGTPWLSNIYDSAATMQEYAAMLEWLVRTFPAEKEEIEFRLGTREKAIRRFKIVNVSFFTKSIDTLEHERAAATDRTTRQEASLRLAAAYAGSGRYLDALNELGTAPYRKLGAPVRLLNLDAFPPQPALPTKAAEPTLFQAAIYWSLWQQRLETEEMFQKKPQQIPELAALLLEFSLLTSVPGERNENELRAVGRRIAAYGRGAMSLALERGAVSYVAVQGLVQEEDVPALIAVLPGSNPEAIHQCLSAATGVQTNLTGEARRAFWVNWWNENAERIVSGKEP